METDRPVRATEDDMREKLAVLLEVLEAADGMCKHRDSNWVQRMDELRTAIAAAREVCG